MSIGCPKVFFLPKQKLIFCTIPKAASSEWRRLLRRVHNGTGTQWCHNYQSCLIHHGDPGSPPSVVSAHQLKVLREQRGYKSAVFLRDPVERVGSMFTGTSHIGGPQPGSMSFDKFVSDELPKLMADPKLASVEHFAPQMLSCNFGIPALSPHAPQWDYVGTTGANHTDTWRRATGFIKTVFGEAQYEQSAADGWCKSHCFGGPDRTPGAPCEQSDPTRSFFGPRETAGAKNVHAGLTPELRGKIEALYAEDVAAFKLSQRYRTPFGAMPEALRAHEEAAGAASKT